MMSIGLDFVEHEHFCSPNTHKKIQTWEMAFQLRTPHKGIQRTSKNIYKTECDCFYLNPDRQNN